MPLHPMLAPLMPLVAALPILIGQDGTQEASQTDIVAIGRDAANRMTVPVRIADHGPFQFLIDTGAQNTVLATSIAARLALPAAPQARLIGVAGVATVDTAHVEQIDLGRRSYYGLLVPLLKREDIGADGILGLDSLQGQRVVIDFARQIVAVGDAKSLGGNNGYEIVVTARRRSGQLIMTQADIDGVRVNVVIDTGAETSIGNRALQAALARHGLTGRAVLRSVTGQEITADTGFARKLDIDHITFQNVLIAYADSPPFAALGLASKPALFLGMRDMRALNRIAIDFSARRIYFDLPSSAL